MGAYASRPLADTASSLQSFVRVFVWIYILLIFAYVLLSWIQLPYSSTLLATVQRFLDEVCRPYLRPLPGPDPDARAARSLADRGRRRPARCGRARERPDRGAAVGGHMPLTPVEIRHVELSRAWLRGYRRRPVDAAARRRSPTASRRSGASAPTSPTGSRSSRPRPRSTASSRRSCARRSCRPSAPRRT